MKLAHIFMLICAAFLSASPALAHGDEVHGDAPSAQVPAQPDKMAGKEGMHGSQIAPGEPVPGEGSAGSNASERESDNAGFFAFLTKLHPATVHFPVALFLMAALAELFMLRGKDTVEPAISVLIYLRMDTHRLMVWRRHGDANSPMERNANRYPWPGACSDCEANKCHEDFAAGRSVSHDPPYPRPRVSWR